jgi:hypothetical protein
MNKMTKKREKKFVMPRLSAENKTLINEFYLLVVQKVERLKNLDIEQQNGVNTKGMWPTVDPNIRN